MSLQKTVRFWTMPDRGIGTLETLRAHLATFLKGQPGLKLEIEVRTAGSMWSGLMRLLKRPEQLRGGRPDVVSIPSHWTNSLAQLGLLEDVSELGPVTLGSWLELLHAHTRKDGSAGVYSVPWWMEVWVLYYREDLMRSLGGSAREELSSWDGLRAACRKLARKAAGANAVLPIANPNPRESVAFSDVAAAVWSRGGDFFSKDGARSLFHRDETQDGMRGYFELIANGWMPLHGRSGLVPEDLFGGRCALQFSGRHPRRGVKPAVSKALRAVQCPRGVGGQTGVVTARHLGVVRGAEQPQAAFALVEHLSGAASTRYADAIGAFSCRPGWDRGTFDGRPTVAEAFLRAFSSARTLPNLTVMASLERIFDRNMERLIRSVLRGTYKDSALREELLYAKAEMDYVLTISRGETP
ncbi:MAG: extracellular solute-binding protein [Proteobacteria bacterium]|nr:extracellular solute-binding protein [Pseudomonadota bacterium]